MDSIKILIIKNGKRQAAELLCDSENLTITFVMENGYRKSYSGDDFYKCLGHVREDHRDILFCVKEQK